MKIDWKAVAASPGYKSMKATVAEEAQQSARRKRVPDIRYQQVFEFAINRAKHYSHVTGISIENILNAWEEQRTYSFLNYYDTYRKPKQHSHICEPQGIRGRIKYYKTCSFYKNTTKAADALSEYLRGKRTKKARWTPEQKKRSIYWKERKSQFSKKESVS